MEKSHTNKASIKLMNKTQKHTIFVDGELDILAAYQIVAGKRANIIYGHSFKGRARQISFDTCASSLIKNDFPRLSNEEYRDMFFKIQKVKDELRAFRENLCLEYGNDKQDS
tara:strand:+ start:3300 stop:3635 length:336 start_codon:yes stop_codon:yes gene_type:complete